MGKEIKLSECPLLVSRWCSI